jgi:hypothetical protein
MIPKIIHYCWLSGDPIPPDYARCMETWKQKLAGYEFVLWDTIRFDIESVLWVKQAFETGQYAFAADYIRLYAVYNYGGIYLDMDMEVVKPFDELLNADIMLARENHKNDSIEAGCFGAEKGHPYIKKCMEYYEKRFFVDPIKLPEIMKLDRSERFEAINPLIIPVVMQTVLTENTLYSNSNIYSHYYFTAKNVMTGEIEKTKSTFTIHHFGAQYHTDNWREIRQAEHRINKRFGENTVISWLLIRALYFIKRTQREGLSQAIKFYFYKYVKGRG